MLFAICGMETVKTPPQIFAETTNNNCKNEFGSPGFAGAVHIWECHILWSLPLCFSKARPD